MKETKIIKIGSYYLLKKCKHAWNNGTLVQVIGKELFDGNVVYLAVDRAGNQFMTGSDNLKFFFS